MHSHVLIHGAIREDGELVAVESRALFVHQRELGAAYRNVLATELGQLGLGIERGTGRWRTVLRGRGRTARTA